MSVTDEQQVQELLAKFEPGMQIGRDVVDELLVFLRANDLGGLLDRMYELSDDELGCGLFFALSRIRAQEMPGGGA